MIVFKTINEAHAWAKTARLAGKTIGLVPTMGALHEGHLSLVRRAMHENDQAIVSIFVNPIQFTNQEDLKKYPRNTEQDLKMLESINCHIVFNPSVAEMYPEKIEKTYEFGELATVMEGEFRPGHFNGVAIVVNRLFEITLPNKAYFGEKDFQQLQIIKALVKSENIDVEIVPCPISREPDGLARSSRNERLTPELRAAAPYIQMVLKEAQTLSGTHTAEQITSFVAEKFKDHPLLKPEYFAIADGETLQPVTGKVKPGSYGFIAIFAGDIRLIDNIRLI